MIDERSLLGDAQIKHGKSRAVLLGVRTSRVFGPEETIPDPVACQLQNTAQVFRNFVVTVDVDLFKLRLVVVSNFVHNGVCRWTGGFGLEIYSEPGWTG